MSEPATTAPAARPARILRSAAVVGAMTAVSRVAGVVREQLMAYAFGTSLAKSAFNVAFQLPNLFRRLFGEGALASAFVPVYTDVLEKEGPEEANRLFARVAGLLVAVLSIISAIGILIALALQHWWFTPDSRWAMILPLLRIMLPYALLICLAALVMGALNAMHDFATSALTPVFLNLVMIIAIIDFCPPCMSDPLRCFKMIAWSVLVAGVVQVAVQLPPLVKRGVSLRLLFDWRNEPHLKRVLNLMAPTMIGNSVFQINVFVDSILAMWAAEWAPAALLYAENIAYLPLGLIGNAFGTVLLPTFSKQATDEDHEALAHTIEHALCSSLIITAPAAVALTVLALPVVEILYLWPGGKFMEQDAIWTMRALAGLAPGLIFFSMQKVLTPAFYALKDARTPLRVGLWGVGMNFTLNVIFVLTWPQGWKHVGLVVSTVLVSAINSVSLALAMRQRIGSPRWSAVVPTLIGVTLAMVGMGLAAWIGHNGFVAIFHRLTHIEKIVQLAALTAAGILSSAVYLLIVRLLCRNELHDVLSQLLRRRKKA